MDKSECNLSCLQGHVTFPPLHEAALNGHIPCLEILIENSANLEKNENQFGTALHVTCLQGHVGCVKVLLQAGANPNSIRRHQAPCMPLQRTETRSVQL